MLTGEAAALTEQEAYTTPTEWSKYRLLDKMLSVVRIPEDARCCEIGCGAGIFLEYLEKRNLRALGIDISQEAVEVAARRFSSSRLVSVRRASLDQIHEKFDAVFIFEVLEHVEDEARFLKYISDNLLKEDGKVFISVPSHQWLFSKGDSYYGHLRRYEKPDLKEKLEKAGLSPVLFWSFGLLPIHLICQHILFRRFYNSSTLPRDAAARTSRSGLLKFPAIWKALYPAASRFYDIVLFIEKAFLNFDIGYSYLVYCRKE
jgi:SAM-dependent methyltransferase